MSELHAVTQAETVRGSSDDDPSGEQAAQAAYAAGAVEPQPRVETFDVSIACTVVGSRTVAEYVGAWFEQMAERSQSISEYRMTVAEREV